MNKRIIRIHVRKLVTAIDRFRRQDLGDGEFGLSPLLRRAGISVADYVAAAFEEAGVPEKLRLLHASMCALEECTNYLVLAEAVEGHKTLKVRIAAVLVSIHLQSYINTLKK